MTTYWLVPGATQVPLTGIVPDLQHSPQDVIRLGSQQAPSGVIPMLGSEHGVTHLPFTTTWLG